MATRALEIREEFRGNIPPLRLGAPFVEEMEKFAIADHPLLEEMAPESDGIASIHSTEPASAVKLALEIATLLGASIRMTFSGLYDWLAGPPLTSRQRDQLNISAADRYWKYRYFS